MSAYLSLLICISVYLGVDPEIYELTTAKTENNATGHYIADAFTKLMESYGENQNNSQVRPYAYMNAHHTR